MHNLLDNALKFTQPGDRIEVRAFEDGASVVIEVADTGPGIPEDEIPRCGKSCIAGRARAASRAAAWGWPWCAPSSSGTAARSGCAAARAGHGGDDATAGGPKPEPGAVIAKLAIGEARRVRW